MTEIGLKCRRFAFAALAAGGSCRRSSHTPKRFLLAQPQRRRLAKSVELLSLVRRHATRLRLKLLYCGQSFIDRYSMQVSWLAR